MQIHYWKITRVALYGRSWTFSLMFNLIAESSSFFLVYPPILFSPSLPLSLLIFSPCTQKLNNYAENYWKSAENRKRFFIRFARDHKFNPFIPENWYSVLPSSIKAATVFSSPNYFQKHLLFASPLFYNNTSQKPIFFLLRSSLFFSLTHLLCYCELNNII